MIVRQEESFPLETAGEGVPRFAVAAATALVAGYAVNLWACAVRASPGVFDTLVLGGPHASRSDLWRVVTAFFFEPCLPGLVVALVALRVIVRDLEIAHGTRWVVSLWAVACVCAALGYYLGDVLLLGRVHAVYLSSLPPLVALCVVYAREHGQRDVYPLVFIPLQGRNLALLVAVALVAAYDFRTMPYWARHEAAQISALGPLCGCLGASLGVLLLPLVRRRLALVRAFREARRALGHSSPQDRVDLLLAKVAAEGLEALSWSELRFLRRTARTLREGGEDVDGFVRRSAQERARGREG
jgi:hypothetical protein